MNNKTESPGDEDVATPSRVDATGPDVAAEARQRYERLRARLTELWANPVPDMAAIDATLLALGDAQAAFETVRGSDGHHTGVKLQASAHGAERSCTAPRSLDTRFS